MASRPVDAECARNLRRTWFHTLYEFASPKMQSWWCGGGPPGLCISYVELMCTWFDDLFDQGGTQMAVDQGWLSHAEAHAIAELHQVADAYEEPKGPTSLVLHDPEWHHVVRIAQHAWCDLHALIDEPDDVAQMRMLESKYGRITRPR